jgi:cupin fold WbuC family metalloprotein
LAALPLMAVDDQCQSAIVSPEQQRPEQRMENRTTMFLDGRAIDEFVARARSSPRRRLNLNLHPELSDPIQRFLNAGESGSYIRPHRHVAQRWELFVVLRGQIDVLLFSDDGAVTQRMALREGGGVIEIAGGIWHSFTFVLSGSVAMEIKPGPYDAQTDKEFAAWAPRENDRQATSCEKWLATASVGQRWAASSTHGAL